MSLSEKEFSTLTELCRIACSVEEKEVLFGRISQILTYVEQLLEIGTQDVEPCYRVVETMVNITREDIQGPTLSRSEFLSNTVQVGGMVRVPPVLNFDE